MVNRDKRSEARIKPKKYKTYFQTGKAKATVVESNKSYELQEVIYSNIKEGSNVITDSYNGYDCLHWICVAAKIKLKFNKLIFNYKHESVKHSVGEYIKESSKVAFKIHTNTVEGMFSHLKRTILGTYYWICLVATVGSKKHTNAYLQVMVLILKLAIFSKNGHC